MHGAGRTTILPLAEIGAKILCAKANVNKFRYWQLRVSDFVTNMFGR
jgi:hypothetical protein